MIGFWGAVAIIVGAFLTYLGAANQRLMLTGVARGPLRIGSWLTLAAGLALLFSWAGPATAVYIAATCAMRVWSLVPLTVAWWRRPRENVE